MKKYIFLVFLLSCTSSGHKPAPQIKVNSHRITVTYTNGTTQIFTNTSHPWPEENGCGFFDSSDNIIHIIGICETEETVKQ